MLSNKRMQLAARRSWKGRSLSCGHGKEDRTISVWELGSDHAAADALTVRRHRRARGLSQAQVHGGWPS